jgi:hypothetical protein
MTFSRAMISAISSEGDYLVYMAVTVFRSRVRGGGDRRLSQSGQPARERMVTRLQLSSSASKVSEFGFTDSLTSLCGRGVRWRSTC